MNIRNDTGHVSGGAGPAANHAIVALLTPMAAPILCFVDPRQAARLFMEWERYELVVKCKQGKVPTLQAASNRASVDGALLKHLVFMECFDEIDPTETVASLTNK